MHTHKLLSEDPQRYEDAALQGIRDLMALTAGASIPSGEIAEIKMGTTVATNALLERKGSPTVLVTTRGYRYALAIGYQNRPDLFALNITKPELLNSETIEIDERILADGTIEKALDPAQARDELQKAFNSGFRSVAIHLMHGYKYHLHEKALACLASEIGFTQASTGHETSPLIKFVSRGDTAVVDAYLSPILSRYVNKVTEAIDLDGSGCKLMFMMSSGGLTAAHLFQGKDAILSGPAGGIVGAAETGRLAGFEKIIAFDMGGTSTDVSYFGGEYEKSFETEVSGARLRVPMMSIHTVAAGGGSIIAYKDGRLQVGPESAGAYPGPASYRNGGPLTVTDANVLTGKLLPDFFPKIFGPNSDEPLDYLEVEKKFKALSADISDGRSLVELADGCRKIAVEKMAQAIKKISVQRGRDVTSCALACFGGAGGQHACAVADTLGIDRIHLHPFSGVLSAYGMGLADIRAHREISIELVLNDNSMERVLKFVDDLEKDALGEIMAQGVSQHRTRTVVSLHCCYAGTDSFLSIQYGDAGFVRRHFEDQHRERFGFITPDTPIVVVAVAVEAIGEGAKIEEARRPYSPSPIVPVHKTQFFSDGEWRYGDVFLREEMSPGDTIEGPAIIIDPHATIVVEEGWRAAMNEFGHLILNRTKARIKTVDLATDVDPVMLEIFNNRFMSVAEEMGYALANTAYSVNIKERLDFSCALFDRNGAMIANAPHVPVHLGSMGASVKSVIDRNRHCMQRGDVYVLNDPYHGGTHLPDVTTVTPVYDASSGSPLFYLAARGHHADIGGITPGSMPPNSTSIEEEGVLIDNLKLVDRGVFQEQDIAALLANTKNPARNIDQNIADLKAQIAACEKGAFELRKMIDEFGLEVVNAYARHVQDNAEESVRRVIDVLKNCEFCYPLDDGGKIKVAIRIDKSARSAEIDFTGTSGQAPNNFNAPASITRAAVLYVFRCLVSNDIPLNDGCLKPLNIILPEGSLLNPRYPAAVVAGNVETSQAVTEALLAALQVVAGSQGTMNNLTFGDDQCQYYETICGGAGAGPDFDGCDAIHSHMTNTKITDPEVLEERFPVVLEAFSIRRNSGGAGRFQGGDGVQRTIRFKKDMEVSILSSRRKIPPLGAAGGGNAQTGVNLVRRSSGSVETLKCAESALLKAGDAITIMTPGGGGYGPCADKR